MRPRPRVVKRKTASGLTTSRRNSLRGSSHSKPRIALRKPPRVRPKCVRNWNLYGYVLNDPINRIDPLGLLVTCTRIELGDRFCCYSIDGGLTPEETGQYEIENAPCYFICAFDDDEFKKIEEETKRKKDQCT